MIRPIHGDSDRALTLIDTAARFQPLFPDIAELVRTAFILPMRHVETSITVDMALGLSGFERQVIARATPTTIEDCSLPVATAEDLVLLKLLAGRPRDTDDAHRIVSRQAENLDWEYLLQTARELERAVTQDIIPDLQRLRRGLSLEE